MKPLFVAMLTTAMTPFTGLLGSSFLESFHTPTIANSTNEVQVSENPRAAFTTDRIGSGAIWDLVYNPKGTTATSLKSQGYSTAFNAAYFGGNAKAGFFPAGFLRLHGQDFWAVDWKDPNLAYFVIGNSGSLSVEPISGKSLPKNADFIFQSGPLLIQDGKKSISEGSWHAAGAFRRTILIAYVNGEKEIVSTHEAYTLDTLADFVFTRVAPKDAQVAWAINLDGGPSVSYITPNERFRPDTKLPYFFVRK